MINKDDEQEPENQDFDISSINTLIEHGKRKGYITKRDIIDCVPAAEYDDTLFEEILASVTSAGVQYIEEDAEAGEDEDEFDENSSGDEGLEDTNSEILNGFEADDMVRLYFKEASRVPLLTSEQEVDLAQKIELSNFAQQELARGNVSPNRLKELRRIIDEGKAAREHLIRANARLVISVAKRYAGHDIPFLDLIQEGNIGLMRAVRNYDYHRGFKFSTYATWWIRQAITRALAEQSRTIRLPVHMSDQINRMRREQNQLQQKLGRPPTREELADALGVPPTKVDQMQEIVKQPVSLQAPVGEDDEEVLGDVIEDIESPNPEETTMDLLMDEDLRKTLETLPPREKETLELRYGLTGEEPLTLNEVGRRMGITRERARQLEAQALDRLRHPNWPRRRRRRGEL